MGQERKASWLFLVGSFLVCLLPLIVWLPSLSHQKREPLWWVSLPRASLVCRPAVSPSRGAGEKRSLRSFHRLSESEFVFDQNLQVIRMHGSRPGSCCLLLCRSWVATSSRFWRWKRRAWRRCAHGFKAWILRVSGTQPFSCLPCHTVSPNCRGARK